MVGSAAFAVATCLLIVAICCRALLADCTSAEMPCSAAARIVWMPLLIVLSCRVSNWAELTAVLWAANEFGLAASDCIAVVKLLNRVSTPLAEPGAP